MSLFHRALGSASLLDLNIVRRRYERLFLENEVVELAYSLVRDVVILTDLRYIEVDVLGLRGVKARYLSIPYTSISAFSVESAGDFDLDAELLLWAEGVPGITRQARARKCSLVRRFAPGVDVYVLQQLLTHHVNRARALQLPVQPGSAASAPAG